MKKNNIITFTASPVSKLSVNKFEGALLVMLNQKPIIFSQLGLRKLKRCNIITDEPAYTYRINAIMADQSISIWEEDNEGGILNVYYDFILPDFIFDK